ncbi:MAG: F-type H+-transporting ATPase subunit epsilon [Bacillota bacterium]|jgi:F-type H+-transporting ATPase subunit epsilon|nr:F-type H+-transporting ATPase subunit epsilon [Bacillota bacterium]
MGNKIKVDVVTPERVVYSGEVEQVIAPGVEGSLGVLPGHAPLITKLGTGPVILKNAGDLIEVAVSEGFLEVMPQKVVILAETAERAEEIDVTRAQATLEWAQAELECSRGRHQHAQALAVLRRAANRLRVVEDYRKRKPERSGRQQVH